MRLPRTVQGWLHLVSIALRRCPSCGGPLYPVGYHRGRRGDTCCQCFWCDAIWPYNVRDLLRQNDLVHRMTRLTKRQHDHVPDDYDA